MCIRDRPYYAQVALADGAFLGAGLVAVKQEMAAEFRLFFREARREVAAVEQQFAVVVLSVADGEIGKEGGGLLQRRRLRHQAGNGPMDVGLAGNRKPFIGQQAVDHTGHNAQTVLQCVPALDVYKRQLQHTGI